MIFVCLFKVLTIFVPCMMWVVVSMIAFWLRKDQLLARLLLVLLRSEIYQYHPSLTFTLQSGLPGSAG